MKEIVSLPTRKHMKEMMVSLLTRKHMKEMMVSLPSRKYDDMMRNKMSLGFKSLCCVTLFNHVNAEIY